ncbi:MAG: PAS domain-containing protein, partial [Sphingobacteriales bacterium]
MINNCEELLEWMPEAIVMLDNEGYISYSNRRTTLITGHAPEALLNKHLSYLYNSKED